jgi:hypothetical protein
MQVRTLKLALPAEDAVKDSCQGPRQRTPAAASELRQMPKEYQARAEALLKKQLPDFTDAALSFPKLPSSTVQQQQQPQEAPGSASTQSSTPKRS